MELAMIWSHWACELPDDDGISLDQMMAAMHDEGHWVTEPEVIGFVAKVTDQTALIYLRLAVDGARVHGTDELMIAVDDRPEFERLLRENCPSQVEWTSLVHIATGTAGALARLRELLDQQSEQSPPAARGVIGGH